MATYVWKWNGSRWVVSPYKKWNGSSWVDAKVHRWIGSRWEQIYPETASAVTGNVSSTVSGMMNWRTSWNNWGNPNEARQGNGNQQGWGGSNAYYGYVNMDASSFTGSGNINAINSASFTGRRGDSGWYNKDQTIKFYRSNVVADVKGSKKNSPVGSVAGMFTCQTNAPDSGNMMNNKPIASGTYNALRDWLNKVSGKSKLYIYSDQKGDYLDIKSASFNINYTHTTRSLLFPTKDAAPYVMSKDFYKMQTGKDPYFHINVYDGEENMSLDEILQRREDGIVLPISNDSIIVGEDTKPWTREYEVYKDGNTQKVKVEVFAMGMDDEAQYSLDGVTWNTLFGNRENPSDNYVYGDLPEDFNSMTNSIYVRVVDKKLDKKYIDLHIEPKILIP